MAWTSPPCRPISAPSEAGSSFTPRFTTPTEPKAGRALPSTSMTTPPALPVFMVSRFGAQWGLDGTDVALVGLAAFLGHLYPVFFGFKGGKGVATAAGVLLAFEPMLGLGLLAIWGLVALVFRYSSLAALVTALASPMLYMAGSNGWWPVQGPILLAIIAMSLLLIWRHRSNISKLFAGTEGKLGSKKK